MRGPPLDNFSLCHIDIKLASTNSAWAEKLPCKMRGGFIRLCHHFKSEMWHMPGMCEVRVPALREKENEKTEGRKEGKEDKVSWEHP